MKQKKLTALCLAMATTLSAFSACGLGETEHEHKFSKFYVAKEATCTEDGILEAICECGEKTYQTLLSVGHKYVNGVCGKCGEAENNFEDSELITLPQDVTLGLSIAEAYDVYESLGFYEDGVEDFKRTYFNETFYLSEMFVDSLGGVHFTVYNTNGGVEIPIPLGDIRVDFPLETSASSVLNQILINANGEVVALETDGTEKAFGSFANVKSIAVTKQNYLLICYNDNTAKVAGMLAVNSAPVVNSNLVYRKEGNSYSVVRMIDERATSVEITLTHRGLPVKKIIVSAFMGCKNLRSAIIGDNVEEIIYGAFENCSALESVVVGSKVKYIGSYAFAGCNNLTSATFKRTSHWNVTADLNDPQTAALALKENLGKWLRTVE